MNSDVRHVVLRSPRADEWGRHVSVSGRHVFAKAANAVGVRPAAPSSTKVVPVGQQKKMSKKGVPVYLAESAKEDDEAKAQRFGKAVANIAVVYLMHEHWITLDLSDLNFPPMGASKFLHNLTFLLFRIRRKGELRCELCSPRRRSLEEKSARRGGDDALKEWFGLNG